MELQVSYRVRAKVQAKSVLRREAAGDRGDASGIVSLEGVEIVEAEVCLDHIHMLVSIPPKISVPKFMGFLKGKSSLMIYQRWGSMKFKYRNRQFWCRGYYVDTVGKNTKAIKEYIATQLKQDKE